MAKSNSDKVFIEHYMEYDIFLDKEAGVFFAENPQIDLRYESRSIHDVRFSIRDSKLEVVNKEYIIKSGYFGAGVQRIQVLPRNKANKRISYKVLDDTGNGYDVGREKDDDSMRLYSLSEFNRVLYAQVKALEVEKNQLEAEQKKLVAQLK